MKLKCFTHRSFPPNLLQGSFPDDSSSYVVSEKFFPCPEVSSTDRIPCAARFHVRFYLKHLKQKEKPGLCFPSSCRFQKIQEPVLRGFGFFPSIHKPFQERGGGGGRDDDVLPGMVVAVFSISCSPHADFIPKFLIPSDTVNDHGEAKTGIFGKLVSLRSSGQHF